MINQYILDIRIFQKKKKLRHASWRISEVWWRLPFLSPFEPLLLSLHRLWMDESGSLLMDSSFFLSTKALTCFWMRAAFWSIIYKLNSLFGSENGFRIRNRFLPRNQLYWLSLEITHILKILILIRWVINRKRTRLNTIYLSHYLWFEYILLKIQLSPL